ncbi:MAG: pyruvate kinase [Thermoanaerobaculia bacterium]|nr:pyruvate kinase [Thermoanaerobaculia bacterium]
MKRRAKIIATLGPASSSHRKLEKLLRLGVDVVRLNLSHGDHESHREAVRRVRRVEEALGRHVPIFMDLMGPRFRLGALPDGPRRLKRGERVTLAVDKPQADLPLESAELLAHLKAGERILVDNGLVELKVESKRGSAVRARVVTGGLVSTRKGINLPDSDAPFTISDKDRADVALAIREGVDYLAASYVGGPDDISALRTLVRELGGDLPIIAKLERGRAVKRIEGIARAADALMVARGDLGVEVPLHRVPVLQKKIIDAGLRFGKPVIVATQMLESMIEKPRPSRAESSDVANAVFDGADALMLSGETAIGDHPVEAVRTMARIVTEAEAYLRKAGGGRSSEISSSVRTGLLEPGGEAVASWARGSAFEVADVVSASAVYAAGHLGVKQIVAFSQGGFTARMIARYRPTATIWVFTNEPRVARRVQLLWGIRPMLIDEEVEHLDDVVQLVAERLRATAGTKPGECIVLLMGDPIPERPLTNLMRIHRLDGA